MATSITHDHSKPILLSKWFANKTLSLKLISFPRRRSKSRSSSLSSPSSPMSPLRTPRASPTASSNINTNKEDEFRQVFRRFDQNDDGKISALELRTYFGSIGEYMSHEQAQAVIKDFDTDGDDLIDFQDFLKLMKRDQDDRHDQDLKSAFEMFELEKGCITPRSLQRMLGRLGDTKSYDECAAMIQVFDTDGNGVLDFDEFHQMMT